MSSHPLLQRNTFHPFGNPRFAGNIPIGGHAANMKVTCHHLSYRYHTSQGPLVVLENVTFTAQAQEFIALVGPSGCGKTTLLKLLAGLLQPTAGRIEVNGDLQNGQPQQAMVFQEQSLLPWLTVQENVAFGLEAQGVGKRDRLAQAASWLEEVGLIAFADRYPHQLSGGMKQRAALARAFIVQPQLLLMDEPFNALDAQTKWLMQESLLRLWNAHRHTILYVTHDIEEAILLSDRVFVLRGRPGTILREFSIPLARPRNLLDRNHAAIQEVTQQIWGLLEADIRQNWQQG